MLASIGLLVGSSLSASSLIVDGEAEGIVAFDCDSARLRKPKTELVIAEKDDLLAPSSAEGEPPSEALFLSVSSSPPPESEVVFGVASDSLEEDLFPKLNLMTSVVFTIHSKIDMHR